MSFFPSNESNRLARIVTLANSVFRHEADAQAFLHTPHPLLGNRTPADAAASDADAQQVERILSSMYYGLPV